MGKDTRLNTLTKLTIPELIKIQAVAFGAKEALVTENQTLTFRELESQSKSRNLNLQI